MKIRYSRPWLLRPAVGVLQQQRVGVLLVVVYGLWHAMAVLWRRIGGPRWCVSLLLVFGFVAIVVHIYVCKLHIHNFDEISICVEILKFYYFEKPTFFIFSNEIFFYITYFWVFLRPCFITSIFILKKFNFLKTINIIGISTFF